MNLKAVKNLTHPHAGNKLARFLPAISANRAASRLRPAVMVVALALGAAACAQAPELPVGADAQLVEGRNVWQARCSTCHGPDGGGGTGPRLNEGRVVDRFPDPADQAVIIHDGKGNMPSFSSVLTEEQIEAVIRYTREIL